MKFFVGNLHERMDAVENAIKELAATQVTIAEQLRAKGNVDADLREHINVVAHDTAALMGAVDKLSELVGAPAPSTITETVITSTPEAAAERVENILSAYPAAVGAAILEPSPFDGDNNPEPVPAE